MSAAETAKAVATDMRSTVESTAGRRVRHRHASTRPSGSVRSARSCEFQQPVNGRTSGQQGRGGWIVWPMGYRTRYLNQRHHRPQVPPDIGTAARGKGQLPPAIPRPMAQWHGGYCCGEARRSPLIQPRQTIPFISGQQARALRLNYFMILRWQFCGPILRLGNQDTTTSGKFTLLFPEVEIA